jgi:integrase
VAARYPEKERWRRAEAAKRELLGLREAELDPSGQTLEVYLRAWIGSLRDDKRARIRPRTLDHYTLIVERHIIPTLGRYRLDRLSERHVQVWLDADEGAPRTIAHHRAVLRRALNVALRQRLLPRNVAVGVELPDPATFLASPFSLDEARSLLAATKDDRLGPLWRLAIDTGLRQAELLGLWFGDLEGDMLTVEWQVQRIHGEWESNQPKAARTLNRIALMPDTVTALERHRLRMMEERQPDWPYFGLMFTTKTGKPYHSSEVSKAFHRACRAAGITERRFHDLRHTAAHLYHELGVGEDVRKARLGHSTDEMARHYAGASEAQDREAVRRLGEALGG